MVKKVVSHILSNPIFFNFIRGIIAGSQSNTKNFVRKALVENKIKSVLDIGCGTGDFAGEISESIEYLGVDINENYILFAKNKFRDKNINFIAKDVTKKSFYQNKKFDATIFVSMLHHLSDEELAEMLPIIKKITRKIIIIADIIPNPEGRLEKFMVKLDQGEFIRTKEAKIKLLSKYFKILKTQTIPSRLAVQYGIICRP